MSAVDGILLFLWAVSLLFYGAVSCFLWGGSLFYDVRGGFGAPFGILIQRWFHSNEGKASWGGMDSGG